MPPPYPINFVGHDHWLESSYSPELAQGDVITRDGEMIGRWAVTDFDPNDDCSSGQYVFIPEDSTEILFTEKFAFLDIRVHRGFALSTITRLIKEWHEQKGLGV